MGRSAEAGYYIWFCDDCGIQGGMTVEINPQCPECQHYRCDGCAVEWVGGFQYPRYGAAKGSWIPEITGRPLPNHSSTPKLALLQKTVTKLLAATPQNDIEKQRDLSSNIEAFSSVPSPKNIPHRISGSKSIPPADIYTLSSRLDVSPKSTETSPSCLSQYSSYEETPSYTTDLGGDGASSDEGIVETVSHSPFVILESHLLAVLGHDLELAAFLIPRIHSQVQLGIFLAKTGYKEAPSQSTKTPGEHSPQHGVNTNLVSGSSLNDCTDLQRRKHNRNPDEDDDDTSNNGGSRRSRLKLTAHSIQRPRFACPFYKKDPDRYCPLTDVKYRTCIGPGPVELRRIKDHFKYSHRPSQCDRCYEVFEDIARLIDHRRSGTCSKRGLELKEGIDDSQMDAIERLLRVKRGMSPNEKEKHDIEKWFEIWTILFPGYPPPPHPWNDSVKPKTSRPFYEVESLMETFESIIELDIRRGNLQRDDVVHQRYTLAVRAMLETARAVSTGTESDSPLPRIELGSRSSRILEFPTDGVSTTLPFSPSSSRTVHSQTPRDPEQSTPPTNTQNSLVVQWETPQELSTPLASGSFDSSVDQRGSSTAEPSSFLDLPSELDQTLGLPLQIETSEGQGNIQNTTNSLVNIRLSEGSLGFSLHGDRLGRPTEAFITGFDFEEYSDATDAIVDNESLTAMLEMEIQLPTAMAPFKDHSNRNNSPRTL